MTACPDATPPHDPGGNDGGSSLLTSVPSSENADNQDSLSSAMPNVARIYDALLGGKDNYEADREAARALAAAVPGVAKAAQENRAFLGRAVRFLAGQHQIGQFLDIGTGLPTGDHVHQVARRVKPNVQVVYADNDSVVVAHARALLADQPGVTAVTGDVRYPRDLLASPAVREALDFSRPVAVLLVAVLHFVADDEDPWAAVRCIVDHLAPGSFLVISHVTGDEITAESVKQAEKIYAGTHVPGIARSRAEVTRFFDGTELTGTGITDAATWHAARRGAGDKPALFWAGIGRKPGTVRS
jgi:SAM-dependent methyltransferase